MAKKAKAKKRGPGNATGSKAKKTGTRKTAVKRAATKKAKTKKAKTKKAPAKKSTTRGGPTLGPPYKCDTTDEPGVCLKFNLDPRTGRYDQPPGGTRVKCSDCKYFFD